MKNNNKSSEMFNFTTTLFFHAHAVNKNTGLVSIYLRAYISSPGQYEEDHYALRIKWLHDKVDRDNCKLLPRAKDDQDANDYNMVIMTERSRLNDIAKKYRLADRYLTAKLLRRELKYTNIRTSVIGYMKMRRVELFNRKEISTSTFKNYGNTINKIEEFDADITFNQITPQ